MSSWLMITDFRSDLLRKHTRVQGNAQKKSFKGSGTCRIKCEDNLALAEDLIVERKVWKCKTGFEMQ